MNGDNKTAFVLKAAVFLLLPFNALVTHAASQIEEIEVVGITPGSSLNQDINKVPFAVQHANFRDLDASQSLDLSDFMNNNLSSVTINSAQNNPLQPDIQFRGFTASPLLGLPQGIAVYQDGVRINEPLGDSVNWDLLPESAIYTLDVISGANPVFGLNTLGGALSVRMKNGFNFTDTQGEVYTGVWDRVVGNLERGANYVLDNGQQWGYYVNLSHFEEEGWRQLSESEATNFYGSLSWRNDESSALDVIYQRGISDLRGNGALPVGLVDSQRDSIFTAPDITKNNLHMLNIDANHFFNDSVQLSGNVFFRENRTKSFNGDGSEFETCEFPSGTVALLEEVDDVEDGLADVLGLELDDICSGLNPSVNSFVELQSLIATQAALHEVDPADFSLEDLSGDLSGTGVITDEAINNISSRKQTTRGFNAQLAIKNELFSQANQLVVGAAFLSGKSDFNSVLELANLDPVTRNTLGLGVGTFLDTAKTDIATKTETVSLFFTNTLDINKQLSLTVAGRYNDTDITLRDRSGERPELNGDHVFARFNPSLGLTYDLNDNVNIYGSYSESNRVPTPIELSCNEGIFLVAQMLAIEEGEDPNEVEFECRLPNAFLADPPLEDVVTKSIELGMRGSINDLKYQVGLFSADNQDDIIFQTTGRSTGLFANVDKTRRWGLESAVSGSTESLDWYTSYSFIEATFEDDFNVLSPNHSGADVNGEIAVRPGDHIPGLPESIFKIGGTYHLSENLSFGGEAVYNSGQYIRGDENNTMNQMDGYTIVNLRSNYSIGDSLSIFVRVTNIFDTNYENFGLLGEDPTEIIPELEDATPVFLGVGAPRGAWFGARYKF